MHIKVGVGRVAAAARRWLLGVGGGRGGDAEGSGVSALGFH